MIDASLVNLDFFNRRRGINARVLSSNPTQDRNKEGEEATKHILVKILKTIKNKEGESHIRKEVWTYKWGMNPLALFSLPVLHVDVYA